MDKVVNIRSNHPGAGPLLAALVIIVAVTAGSGRGSRAAAPVAPVLGITTARLVGFQSQTNTTYQLWASSDLRNWEPLHAAVQGTGAPIEIPVDSENVAHRFFRLQAAAAAEPPSSTAVVSSLRAREQAAGAAEVYLPTAVEAVVLASALGADAQRLVVHGTLRPEAGQWVYVPEPTDRLDVVLTNGTLSLAVAALQGDFEQSTIDGFFSQAHHLDITFQQPERGLNLRVESTLSGVTERLVIRGTLPDESGTVYSVDLQKAGTRNVSVEVNSASYEVERVWQGTIEGGGLSMLVDSAERYKSLFVTSFVENWTRVIRDTWSVGGRQYRMDEVTIQLALKDNQVADLDSYWLAQGNILLDGAVYASLELGRDALGYVTVQWRHPGGVEILERYRP